MAEQNSIRPVIIKKKKVVAGGGHHGGAWKVAYADFVTAMMAFFMLMWLLNATTEKQRKGIADHFNPSIPINRISGGGDGAFGGDSIFSENTLAKSGTGSSGQNAPWLPSELKAQNSGAQEQKSEKLLEVINATLAGGGGESDLMENALKHVISKVSDEGVIIEVFDLPDRPLFATDGTVTRVLALLLTRIVTVSQGSENSISIRSHAKSEPLAKANIDLWQRTMSKSLIVRDWLENEGVNAQRFDRIVGKANTSLFSNDALSVRNNRVEVIFLVSSK
ncbi:MAG: flagellar motor protein MotB [Hyphomicrobiales bacterium]